MFVRVDKDVVVNMNQITMYIISEDFDSYKLVLFQNDKTPYKTLFYMKDNMVQMEILLSFIEVMNNIIANPENIKKYNTEDIINKLEGEDTNEEENISR